MPTIADRTAQAVVTGVLVPVLEPGLHEDSYGYRPNRSAHQAIEVTQARCRQIDWVLEYDIRGLFDNIDHALVLKALRRHTQEKWILLYVERWLTAPMQEQDGALTPREKGCLQGSICNAIHIE
ncbi:reverse transcriptase domain-containing protein [Granulosicoccus antarcticus]|uniref:reverse transcriptase domain-containing protein n=1 Tax=Granulosicoccus antarcticus TaxID=437505 RepID=UPI003AAF059B